MAKKRQMRWTDEGAHCMALMRVAVLNGKLPPRCISALRIATSRQGEFLVAASAKRHWPTNRTDHATEPYITMN
jgi:hypothetical protein